jgi:hypothetical protein
MEQNCDYSENQVYCCNLCYEEKINKEKGAKMCTLCQKPICIECYQSIQRKRK